MTTMEKERSIESRQTICRLCLGTLGYFVNIFDNLLETDSLAKKIMHCAAIEVKKFDGLPESACHRCVAKVESSYEFRLLCESSDAKLRRLLLPKILDEELYDVEGEKKQVLDSEINEQALSDTTSEEIQILFVSSKRTSVPRGRPTKTCEATVSTSELKRAESTCNLSKFFCNPEPLPNDQPELENDVENISVSQVYSVPDHKVHISVDESGQCLEYATEECDQQNFNAYDTVSSGNVQIQRTQENQSNGCYSFPSTLENGTKTNPILFNETEIISPSLSSGCLEVLSEHAKFDPITEGNVMLGSERVSSLLLNCSNNDTNSGDDAQNKYGTTYSLSPREHSYSEVRSETNKAGNMVSESMLPASASHSEQEDLLHSHSRDVSQLDRNSRISLQEVDSVNNIHLPQKQSNIKKPLRFLLQSRHASAENAAEALIMLSNSAENSSSVPDSSIEPNTISAGNLTNKIICTGNVGRTTDSNENNLFDTCLKTTLSLIQVENDLTHNVKKDITSNNVSKIPEKTFNSESINVKIKRISGKYSVEKVSDYKLDMSPCIIMDHTDINSGDAQAQIASEEPRKTKTLKKDNSCTRKRVSAKYNEALTSPTQRSMAMATEPLLRNCIPSEENSNADLDLAINSVPKSKSSGSQSLNEDSNSSDCTINNSETSNVCNSIAGLRNDLQDKPREIPAQQKISVDFSKTDQGEGEVVSTDILADTLSLANTVVKRNNLNKQRENTRKISKNAKCELTFSKGDSYRKSTNEKRLRKRNYEKRGYSNRKKSRIKHKLKYYDSHVNLSDNQHPTENNSNVTCPEFSNKKLSIQGENKANKQLSYSGETCSAPKHNSLSCRGQRTKTKHCDDISSPKEKDISTVKKQHGDICGLALNGATNYYQRGCTTNNTSLVNSDTSKTGSKTEIPLKELRVLLVRLEMNDKGRYFNGGKVEKACSIQSSDLGLPRQTSISNSPQQNTLSNLCSLEGSTKRQTLYLRSCSQKLDSPEDFGAASVKVSHRKHIKDRQKIKTRRKQYKTSKVLTVSPLVSNSSVPNSSDSNICVKLHKNQVSKYAQKTISRLTEGLSNRSENKSNMEECRSESAGISSENAANNFVETRKTIGRCHDAVDYNSVTILRHKDIFSVDNMTEAETHKQRCSNFSKGKLVTSIDSGGKFPSSQTQFDISLNSSDNSDQPDNYKMTYSNKTVIPTNISLEGKTLHSSKSRESVAASKATNKQSHKRIRAAEFKVCEQVNNQSNNFKPFTPSEINKSREVDATKNYKCARDKVGVSRCNNASPTTEVNNKVSNIKSRSVCGEKCRKSKTLTIEHYRKLRQSELLKWSELNSSSNNNHDMGTVQPYGSYFSPRTSNSDNSDTINSHAGKKSNISPRLESFYTDQRGFGVNNSSLNHSINSYQTNSELWQHSSAKESRKIPRNFLGSLSNKNEAISVNANYKAPINCSSVFHIDQQNKCQQILQSENHSSPAYKQMIETYKNIINSMISAHRHDNDDEQCQTIRKEILKSAYMIPQLAVLTADSPQQPPISCFEECHPTIESVLSTVTNICCRPISSDLRGCEGIENILPADLHKGNHQVRNSQNKNEDAQDNKRHLEMEVVPHLDLKESDDSSKVLTPTGNVATKEKTDIKSFEVKSNNNIALNEKIFGERSVESSRKGVTSSSTLKEQLNRRKYEAVLQNRSKSIHCTTGTVSVSPQKTTNDAKNVDASVQKKHEKGIFLDESLLKELPKDTSCSVKSVGNENINGKYKTDKSVAVRDSGMEANLSGIQNERNALKIRSSLEEKGDGSFRPDAISENFFENIKSVDNSAGHIVRKALKRKCEPNEEKVARRTSEDDKSSSTGTGFLIEKETCISKALEYRCSDDPVKENVSCNYAKQDVQEYTVHQQKETIAVEQSTEFSNPASLSCSEVKSQEALSNALGTVINEGISKKTTGRKHNSVASDLDYKPPSIAETDFVPDYELSDCNSESCSDNNSQTAHDQGSLPLFPIDIPNCVTPFEPSLGTQLRCEVNISSNHENNNENQAPKRVCYTSNFIRKDLCNDNVLPKAESKRFTQSKSAFSFRKATRIDRRSKSLESRPNSKPNDKLRMNLVCRKSETLCTKSRDGIALSEISHQQGENDNIALCDQKLSAEPVSSSVSSTAESTFTGDRNVSKNNSDTKHTSEVQSLVDHSENLDIPNLFSCKRSCSLEGFREGIKRRALESRRKINAGFLSNDDSKHRDKISNYISSKNYKLSGCVEENSLSALKRKSENLVFSSVTPQELTSSISEQIMHAQKTDFTVTNTFSLNTDLEKKRNGQMNAVVCDISNRRFASQNYFLKHERLHYRERSYTNNNNYYKRNGALRAQQKLREAYPFCNRRTNGPLRPYWRVAPDCFRSKTNGRRPFYRRNGLRNNRNIALSRLSENLPI